jgi:ribosomal-protein-alanine N-acetyltransferase
VLNQVDLQTFFLKFPVIEIDKNLYMRELRMTDAPEYLEILSNPEVAQYLAEEDVPNNIQESVREIEYWGGLFNKRMGIFWAIAEKKSDKMIGTLGFSMWSVKNHRCEVMYDLHRKHWRKRIMSRAMTKAIEFAEKKMKVHRIEAKTMMHNNASMGLLEKFGFKREAILHKYRVIRGVPSDVTLYALVK